MRLSNYFFKTVKETPAEAELKSHKLMIRGGYIKQVSAGIFSYLPIAIKTLRKIENIIREEMVRVDSYEVNLPVVMPSSLWSETGRYESVGDEMLRFTDRIGRKMLLGMTHEEAVTDLARYVINSYKQLPVSLFQLQTKFRDEPRVRGGLIRVREFIMKDAYSFHPSTEDLDKYYNRVYDAYFRIFKRCGVDAIAVSSDVGMMGGSKADEFMAVTDCGEDTLILCPSCGYKANKEVATAKRVFEKSTPLKPEIIHTPDCKTIEEVSSFLGLTKDKMLKSLVYKSDDSIVMCVIRGDLDVNEVKLKNLLKTQLLVLAEDEDLKKFNIIQGYATPVNLDKKVKLIADISVANSSNLVAGSDKYGYHTKNINFDMDYKTDIIADISSVKEGDKCPDCGALLNITRGIEIGNIFKLGTKYSSSMKAVFLDENGKEKDLIMGCYGIGVGRLMATAIEKIATERRIIWPISISPFEIELIGLGTDKNPDLSNILEQIYNDLKLKGYDVIYDDRKASPGIKFNDADLIGAPVRVIIGEKSLINGGAEVHINDNEPEIIKISDLIDYIDRSVTNLKSTLSP